jgi:hypothetical protein
MYKLLIMKKYVMLISTLLCYQVTFCQNVGVNTPTPEATLDVNGDIIIRTAALSVPDGTTLALDVNTTRFSYYRITGPTANFTLAGITAGIDGRLLTLFNRSGFTMQLNNEDVNTTTTDMIVTGTGADITIVNKGIVNLQYDATEQKWIVRSSSKAAIGGGGGFWDASGSNIVNNNAGNVGIGTSNPVSIFTIQTPINTTGWTHVGGSDSIIVREAIGGVSAAIGTSSEHALRLTAGALGRVQVYPTGDVVIGDNNVGSVGRLTVKTTNNADGISHIGDNGNILKTRMGGTSAGIGTFSNTHMRIFANGVSAITITGSNGNVGVGIDFPVNKFEVNGTMRSKEVIVEAINWPDYVFDKKYKIPLLSDVEKFIIQYNHLPNIPSATEIKNKGLHLGDTQKKMMEKIEELTLYIIQQQKEIDALKKIVFKNN